MPITISGSGTVTGISAGGLPDDCITTVDIAAGAVTQAKRSEQLTLGTAVASTTGTSIDFTGIPSWVKRVTVMFDGVSLNGTSEPIIQLGTSGGIQATGYNGAVGFAGASAGVVNFSTGFSTVVDSLAAAPMYGSATLTLVASGTWVYAGCFSFTNYANPGAGSKTLSGTLDRIRITVANGTDTFDAGTVNIMYE